MEQRRISTDDGGHLALYSYGNNQASGEHRILVIGGAFLTALIYRPFSIALAKKLGDGWAVDVYDRRGRGGSSDQPADYSMNTEIQDVKTLLDHTGARNIFGHSLGGSVALHAVQSFAGGPYAPGKLAVYDPAINLDATIDMAWLPHFEASVNQGNLPKALAIVRRGMQPGSPLGKVPEPILIGLMAMVSRTKVNKMFKELMPSGVGELKAAMGESATVEDFAQLPASTAFIVGAKSPKYYRSTAQQLHAGVQGSTLKISPKMVHGSIPAAVNELVTDVADYFTGTASA
ncbi:MAG: alpha/beta hydrolase [Acidobacteria bacterium]|nr:alpha/beta hydrolase [Acidobacteriota bacterium]